jgi:hypothetical protein
MFIDPGLNGGLLFSTTIFLKLRTVYHQGHLFFRTTIIRSNILDLIFFDIELHRINFFPKAIQLILPVFLLLGSLFILNSDPRRRIVQH